MNDQLKEIYNQLPELNCKGKCHDSCGPIMMAPAEEKNITQSTGKTPPEPKENLTCDKLIPLVNKCSIYNERPLVCRLFGIAEGMKCPHGCTPEGGHISDVKAFQLMTEAESL